MSEQTGHLDPVLESRLRALAPDVPSAREVEDVAVRARGISTAGARTGWQSWRLAAAVAALVVFAAGLAVAEGFGGLGHTAPKPLAPREGVPYYKSGVYAASDTTVAVGILRYRSTSSTQGEWLLVSTEDTSCVAPLAADVHPFAVLTGVQGFDPKLAMLDGQYVAAEGSTLPAHNGVIPIKMRAVSLVSDMFPTATNEFTKPGLYTLPDGSLLAWGFAGPTVDGITTLYDRSSDATGPARAIARVEYSGKTEKRFPLWTVNGHLIEKGPVPLLKPFGTMGFEPDNAGSFPGKMTVGTAADKVSGEAEGIKDRPNSRTRVVGTLTRDPRGPLADRLRIWLSPGGPGSEIVLDDPSGLVPAAFLEGSCAAEGVLSKDGYLYRLRVEKFEVVQGGTRAPGGHIRL